MKEVLSEKQEIKKSGITFNSIRQYVIRYAQNCRFSYLKTYTL